MALDTINASQCSLTEVMDGEKETILKILNKRGKMHLNKVFILMKGQNGTNQKIFGMAINKLGVKLKKMCCNKLLS